MSDASQPPPHTREFIDPTICVVLPVYNESMVLRELVLAIKTAFAPHNLKYNLLFINDGSSDGSGKLLDALALEHSNIQVLHFSRNFGHAAAVQAGLDYARGDVVALMDSDMQDDPRAIPTFIEHWRAGYDVIYAVRVKRKEGFLKRLLFAGFYRFLNAISELPVPEDAGNFGLLDGNVAKEIAALTDRDRYFPGLRSWVGYRQIGVTVERLARYDNKPRVSMMGLFRLAKSAIFSFSSLPLTIFYLIAWLAFVMFASVAGFTLYHRVVTGLAVPGWTSNLMVASFFGAINALGIAILGEYVIRIYHQVRARPMYLVARKVNIEPTKRKVK